MCDAVGRFCVGRYKDRARARVRGRIGRRGYGNRRFLDVDSSNIAGPSGRVVPLGVIDRITNVR